MSESIISGMPMRLGTGFFDLLQKTSKEDQIHQRKLVFDDESLHCKFSYEVDQLNAPRF